MGGKNAWLAGIKLLVLDLDGTFYLGGRIFPWSLPFVERARETGRQILFFTNNTSRSPDDYVEKLAGMGLAIGRGGIVTAGDVTIKFLHDAYPGRTVFLMGTEALRRQFAEAGIRLVGESGENGDNSGKGGNSESGWNAGNSESGENGGNSGKGDNSENGENGSNSESGGNADSRPARRTPDVVVAAFDTELTYRKLERACTHIRDGAAFCATHPDINCPTEGGFIPDCGAFIAAMEKSTGRAPRILGKPYPEALEYVLARTGLSKEETAFVGDRLYTDVAAGVNNGAKGILVLSGETKEADIARSEIKPDAVYPDLGALAQDL